VKPRKKKPQTRRINKKPAFLAAYIACADLTAAAAAIGINRGQHYDWLRKDPKYVEAFAAADVEATQTLYDSAVERALRGVYEPIVYQGRFSYPQEQYEISPAVEAGDWKDAAPTAATPAVMGWRDVPGAPPLGVYRRSEALHLGILRAKIPAFRTNATELTGAGGGAIQSEHRIVFVKPGELPA
jgi:hypothetical protein